MRRMLLVLMLVAVVSAACSNDDDGGSGAGGAARSTTTSTPAAARTPAVAPATLEGPITVGTISPPADPRPVDLDAIGYVEEEYFASGTATAYAADDNGRLRTDGRWKVVKADSAPYKTRFVVRRPRDAATFNGTVVVEWLNVTVVEAAPDWSYTNKAIVDAGAAWVGLSAQALGVVGGTSLLQSGTAQQQEQSSGGIRGGNPERYGSLVHPGDRFAFDIVSQVGAALRSSSTALGGTRARRVILAGESQSAGYLTTYVNAVQPVSDVFDGFFVHSRGSGAAQPDGTPGVRGSDDAYRFRTDLDVPVMVFETETDVGPLLRYAMARQPDTDHLRVWEVAGTSHADAYLVGASLSLLPCSGPINNGPQHYVATAAMAALVRWVERGTAPPKGQRIETTGADGTTVVRDAHGLVRGGIRTPAVDVPVSALSGEAPAGTPVLCALFGSSHPFDAATLTSLYPTRQAYLDAFDHALDHAIDRGFVRRADRAEFAAEARAVTFP